ncbi:MAG: gamma-glutamyl-gamma-aminobutyrate hydrolase family protein [Eubacteriales bacterium]
MKKKKIVLSQRVDVIESYGETRDSLDQNWTEFIVSLGMIPFPTPNFPDSLSDYLEVIQPDGILLTGGSGPVSYGGNSVKRDKTDDMLLAYAIGNKIPLMGVCRGMQSLGCFFGGVLEEISNHIATNHPISGKITRSVNSYHGWGFRQLDDNIFEILATSSDGMIEGICHREHDFVGIMWHPERVSPFSEEDIALFQKTFQKEG